MKTVIKRIAQLEDRFATKVQPDFLRHPRKRLRLVVSGVASDGVPDLAKCSAKRVLCVDGTLMETLTIDGNPKLIDGEKLEEWVRSQPVTKLER
jgi:hypothetical protein